MITDPLVRRHGFTLVEVLVALAIIALGLIGVFGQLNQSAAAASRLRDKTLADWVAINVLTELRLSGAVPGAGTKSDTIEMANTKWHTEMKISETEGGLRRADVSVSFADRPDRPVAVAAGFIVPHTPTNPQDAGSGWPACGVDFVPGTGGPSPGGNKPGPPAGGPPGGPPGPNPTPPSTNESDQ